MITNSVCAKYAPTAPNPRLWTIVLVMLLLALAAVAVCHAVEKHGSEAILARSCAERPEYRFYNPNTGRTALVCLTEVGKYGVYVIDQAGHEVTAFLKNKMKFFCQVKKSLENLGYGLIQ